MDENEQQVSFDGPGAPSLSRRFCETEPALSEAEGVGLLTWLVPLRDLEGWDSRCESYVPGAPLLAEFARSGNPSDSPPVEKQPGTRILRDFEGWDSPIAGHTCNFPSNAPLPCRTPLAFGWCSAFSAAFKLRGFASTRP